MADLTTIEKVKTHAGISGSAEDAMLTELVDAVSRAMEQYTGKTIALQSSVIEYFEPEDTDTIVLRHRAETVNSVTVGGTVLAPTYYVLRKERILWRLTDTLANGGIPTSWGGKYVVEVDYDAGYSTIPADWDHFCVKQCRHEWNQTEQSVANRFAEESVSSPTGENASFVGVDWLPDVENFLKRQVRIT